MEVYRIIPPEHIISAYQKGFFPMAESAEEGAQIYFYTAEKRGVIPLESFQISKRTLRYIRKYGYKATCNQNFEGVITGCANRISTWISPEIKNTYIHLHEMELAHSIEVWKGDRLIGGLYGIALGRAFFAESMFQTEPEGHKAALYFCHQALKTSGFTLWDTQFYTEHLGQFGCIEITAVKYKKWLKEALKKQALFKLENV